MKIVKITEYVADDGNAFRTEAACIKYEEKIRDIAEALRPLGNYPNIPNGHWIRHDPENILKAGRKLLGVISKHIRHRWVDQAKAAWEKNDLKDINIHPSWIARLLSDHGEGLLEKAWYRICSINLKTGKEYNQPYYAEHPEDASGKDIKA